jgi:hypothetical protein
MFVDEYNNQSNVLDFLSGLGKTTRGAPKAADRVGLKAGHKNNKNRDADMEARNGKPPGQ